MKMRAIITVIGQDQVGICAKVSTLCAEHNVNITAVSQNIFEDLFCMVMLVETDKLDINFGEFSELLSEQGKTMGLDIRVMHEDIFNSMHRI